MNALLHEIVNARDRSSEPDASPSKFRNFRPSTVISAGHGAGVEPLLPAASSAADVMTLNVEPGGYVPTSARGYPPYGFDTTAVIAPVVGLIATSAAFFGSPASAASAARCVARSIVSRTGCAALPGKRFTVFTVVPLLSTITRSVRGDPASRFSNVAWSPDSPT